MEFVVYSNKEILKAKASALFVGGLSDSIKDKIERDANDAANKRFSMAIENKGVAPYSAATLFLADLFYAGLGTGSFRGLPRVSWNGMDQFVYEPDLKNPFAYVTASGKIIEPQIMDTDGGSIPQILRGLSKFSSWGYAPAFIIHDWLFTAKKCGYTSANNWQFSETSLVMAEAMKTLMKVGYTDYDGKLVRLEKAEDTLFLMYLAVNSFIAEDLWNDDQSVVCRLPA